MIKNKWWFLTSIILTPALVVSCGEDNRRPGNTTTGGGGNQTSDGAAGIGGSSGSDRVVNTDGTGGMGGSSGSAGVINIGGKGGNAGASGGAAAGGVGFDSGTKNEGGSTKPGIDASAGMSGGGTSGSNGGASGSPPPPACSKPFAPGLTTRNLTAAGAARTYWLFVPASYDGSTRIPLVFNLHGRLSNATQEISVTDLNTKGEREGFIVVSPECIGDAWNVDLDPSGPDDVAFVTAMIDELEQTLCIDTKRIYSTGYSAGGRMSSRLACEISQRIASIAPVGGIRYPQPCKADRPVAVITFHGTSDTVNPYDGGGETYWGTGVEDAMGKWATHNSCSTTPIISNVSASVDKLQYNNCDAGVELILYRVEGGGHTWPGSPNPPSALLFGATTQEISANDLMWEFFKAHPLP
jgi:polyhydroxybutyrate depolymerase